jgi:threonine dehydrogenase-like Zn-dependent dehydrogenase
MNFCRQATMETALGFQSDGGLEPLVVVSPKTLRRVPEGAGRFEAAWVEPAATALRAARLAGSVAGKKVLVTGGGPIGQLACRLDRLQGAGLDRATAHLTWHAVLTIVVGSVQQDLALSTE